MPLARNFLGRRGSLDLLSSRVINQRPEKIAVTSTMQTASALIGVALP